MGYKACCNGEGRSGNEDWGNGNELSVRHTCADKGHWARIGDEYVLASPHRKEVKSCSVEGDLTPGYIHEESHDQTNKKQRKP